MTETYHTVYGYGVFCWFMMNRQEDHDRNLPRCVRLRWFVLNREEEETLLQSKLGPASFLQGVFMLQKGDTLRVKATAGKLYTDRGQSTYLGLYLIRT